MHFVIYGPEGSGKGTQAKLLSEKLGLPVYTAGDLVREVAGKNKGYIGEAARSVLREGKYLPDKEICFLFEEKLKRNSAKRGFILDGFPRTLPQAQFLLETISRLGFQLDKVIYLKLDRNETIKRLKKRKRRLYAKSKILHDDPERIRQRLKIYQENEEKLLPFFRKKNLLLEIEGAQPIKKVFHEIIVGLGLVNG